MRSTEMTEESRVKTYIEGFDEILGGGIPEGSVVLLCGQPGTMKSSVAFSILYNNSLHNQAETVYVSLEQRKNSLIRQMKSMGFDAETQNRIRIMDLSGIREELEKAETDETVISVLREYLQRTLKDSRCSIFVLDSLNVIDISAGHLSRRSQIFFLFEWLREMNMTSILISESSPEDIMEKGIEEGYLSDGIINLSLSSDDESAVARSIRCVKMRGTPHDTSFYSLQFRNGRFAVTESMR
ncbi:MAG: RAD55 family ATPase [Thermoplasmata archaeon]|uniref:AAA family ATPase n=1 Tax=Candidatus Sysuiplasma superficiale TaxID=2823368 RepID=A0A8J7YMF9_9ARCH|nr:AAA family ATPase [Candidatus Sysuiplasma superficiale]MBX8643430.1 RAD55 family ATPase [Candidatus Sysuiplasma superficiale]